MGVLHRTGVGRERPARVQRYVAQVAGHSQVGRVAFVERTARTISGVRISCVARGPDLSLKCCSEIVLRWMRQCKGASAAVLDQIMRVLLGPSLGGVYGDWADFP
jgi:hypothetical protein